jgi:rare lipoprotein A
MLKLSKYILIALFSIISATVYAEAVVNTETVANTQAAAKTKDVASTEEGEASYYSDVLDGRKTASGGIYDKTAMTAAHHTLKFGTKVKVTYLETGKSVIVVINDRIPGKTKRTIDLSRAAAEELGLIKAGHAKVKLEIYVPEQSE